MNDLTNAADNTDDVQTLTQGPHVETVLNGSLTPVTFELITSVQNEDTFEAEEKVVTIATSAVIQPLRTRELALKPEGERSWSWYKVYALPQLRLKPGDRIKISETTFRVMGLKDWRSKGYMYYELVDAYTLPTGYE